MLKRTIRELPEHLFPPDEWRIVEARYSDRYFDRAETIFALANGYLGIRGTLEEGRPTGSPGAFVSGFHETWPIVHAENAYGLARTGQTIVNVPDATIFRLFVEDEPLFLPTARLRRYARVLDMRDGTLTRELAWATPAGRRVVVRSCRLVSLEARHVAAMTYEVVLPYDSAPVVICSQFVNRQDGRHRDGRRDGRPRRSPARHQPAPPRAEPADRGGRGRPHAGRLRDDEQRHDPRAGDRARDRDGVQPPHLDVARRRRRRARAHGRRPAWRADQDHQVRHLPVLARRAVPRARRPLEPDARPRAARRLRVAARAPARAARLVLGPRRRARRGGRRVGADPAGGALEPVPGLPGLVAGRGGRGAGQGPDRPGLRGPVLLGRRDLRAAVPGLHAAADRAQLAALPAQHAAARARAGPRAEPVRRAVPVADDQRPGGLRQLPGGHRPVPHQRRHRPRGSPLRQRARRPRLPSRGGRRVARGDGPPVGGPRLLRRRRRLPHPRGHRPRRVHHRRERQRLHEPDGAPQPALRRGQRPPAGGGAAGGLRRARGRRGPARERGGELGAGRRRDARPLRRAPGIHPQDASFLEREVWDLQRTPAERFPLLLHYHPLFIYRHQVIKQADVVLATFLLGNEFSLEQKRANFRYYDDLTTGDSSLSACVQSIVAAELGDDERALEYFRYALMMDLADVAGNVSDGVHIASAAGLWQALVFGFGGVRDFDGRLSITPHLPGGWDSLAFSLRFQNRQLRVVLTRREERYLLEEGEPLELDVRGTAHRLSAGQPLVLEGAAEPARAEASRLAPAP